MPYHLYILIQHFEKQMRMKTKIIMSKILFKTTLLVQGN